jgi:hypothetical protein
MSHSPVFAAIFSAADYWHTRQAAANDVPMRSRPVMPPGLISPRPDPFSKARHPVIAPMDVYA